MNFMSYLKDKFIVILICFATIVSILILLFAIDINIPILLFIFCILIFSNMAIILFEYFQKYTYYKNVQKLFNNIDKKYLISEIIAKPDFYEGKLFYDILKYSNKSMNDEINKYKLSSEEYREYIETWVHEIKNPISSLSLILDNNRNEVTSSIKEELLLVEKYVEQALYYSRSNNVEKDYIVKKNSLERIVNNAVKKNSKMLIESKIQIEITNINCFVYTDEKWTTFIISQILDNSIKYKCKENSVIKIYSRFEDTKVVLYIKDNGIGIDSCDVDKVFEKGFTGSSGRIYTKSTGIGLYLCRKLCNKIGLNIFLESKINNGTTVKIIFPKTNMYDFK